MSTAPLVFDGLEFKERETLARYVSLKRTLGISSIISLATVAPAMGLLLLYYVSPHSTSPYLYLVFLGISIPFTYLSFTSHSKMTELLNSNDVRHVAFAR